MFVKVAIVAALVLSFASVAFGAASCTNSAVACVDDNSTTPDATTYVRARSFFNATGFNVAWTTSKQYDGVSFKYRRGPSSTITSTMCDYDLYTCTDTDTGLYTEYQDNCTITVDSFFGKTLQSITDVLGGASKCFEAPTSDGLRKTYKTTVQIVEVQNQPALRAGGSPHPRTWVSYKDLTISFPVLYNVSITTISAFSAVNVLSDFRYQSYNPPGSLTLRIFTSVQYPYQLTPTAATIVSGAANLSAVTTPVSSSVLLNGEAAYVCDSTLNSVCEQLWTVDITLAASACVFGGSIKFDYTIGCRTGFTGNCAAPSPPTYTTTVALQSDDVCGKLIEDVQVTGTLTSYESVGNRADGAPGMTNFVFSHQAYFLANISGPSISLVAVQRVLINSTSLVILTRSDLDSTTSGFHFTDSSVSGTGSTSKAFFDFTINSHTFTTSNSDAAQSVSVIAEVQITFANLASTTKLMNFILRPRMQAEQPSSVGTTIVVSPNSSSASPASAATGSAAVIIGAVVGGVFLLGGMIGLVAYRVAAGRRRAESERQLVDAPTPKVSSE